MYRGGAEQKIRKYLIDNNYIECIIQLPDNLFYGTSIATCIMVLKKSKVDNQTLFIDASKEFRKEGPRNYLDPEHINKIVDVFLRRQNVDKFAYLASFDEIESNDFNLNIARYIDSTEEEEEIDIEEQFKRLSSLEEMEKELDVRLNKLFCELGIVSSIGVNVK